MGRVAGSVETGHKTKKVCHSILFRNLVLIRSIQSILD